MNGRFTRIRWTPAKRNKITGEIWVPDKLRLRETFQINQWGNLNKILPYSGKPQPENLNQMAGNNNRFTGMSYDAAGNLLNDGASTYFYDAENQIKTGAGVTYQRPDRKSTRLNSSHLVISYAVFCLKKKKKKI